MNISHISINADKVRTYYNSLSTKNTAYDLLYFIPHKEEITIFDKLGNIIALSNCGTLMNTFYNHLKGMKVISFQRFNESLFLIVELINL